MYELWGIRASSPFAKFNGLRFNLLYKKSVSKPPVEVHASDAITWEADVNLVHIVRLSQETKKQGKNPKVNSIYSFSRFFLCFIPHVPQVESASGIHPAAHQEQQTALCGALNCLVENKVCGLSTSDSRRTVGAGHPCFHGPPFLPCLQSLVGTTLYYVHI